ncbi:MAG: alpha/beta hydrolase [Deltaproteobacteria bacterium]|nr:alpha/beta hydrolase [Deltaproteobacteria bacterium]
MATPVPERVRGIRPDERPSLRVRPSRSILPSRSLLAVLLLCAALAAGWPAAATADPASAPSGADASEQFLQEPVFGGRAYIREAGRQHSFSVVLIHGLGEDASHVWDGLIPVLAARYHVVAFDLPGFGRSSKPDALYSPAAEAAFVQWVVDRTVSGRFAVVGHSLGGAVALHFSAGQPPGLDRLILVDVAGVLHRLALTRDLLTPSLTDWMPWAPAAPLQALENLVRSAVEKMPSVSVDLGSLLKTPYLRQKILGGDPTKIAALALAEDDMSAILGRVRAPTLVLWGADDKVASARTATLLATTLSNARLLLLPGAGHEPMREQPRRFNEAVLDWLRADTTPKAVPEGLPPSGSRVGTCDGQQGVAFTGDYLRIEVKGCTDVRISEASAQRIEITGSTVQMDNCRVRGDETGMLVRNAFVEATGVTIEAADAMVTSDSRLDLAGVELIGQRNAIRAEKPSTILFSVSRATSPHTSGYLHGVREVSAEHPL